MKKILLLLIVLGTSALSLKAQTKDFELGIRAGYGVAMDLALPLNNNRIHSNLGWGTNYFKFDNYFDFQQPLNRHWMVYPGIGGGVRYWDRTRSENDGFGLAVLFEIGLEYRFDTPISVGIDWAPSYDFVMDEADYYGSICIRLRFESASENP